MPSLGPLEILVIFIVALLVFGPDKLPELARQVGKGLAEFRRVQHHLRGELDDAIHSVMDDDKPKVASPIVTTEPGEVPAPIDAPEVEAPSPPPPTAETPPAEKPSTEPGPTPPPLADDAS